ncbi:UbiA prenyltransferase domain-containing protein [Klebsormidium nitens]|uniref:UbiA prenyltransferase domain-containing protein n=1 Tax=Klebsormidium nitens TaxID=105231 RepID=A0A0U9HPG6_KLENI|nr:UbiA prenyltransferase domain-containing protein [Klebsormidium nitens]|eukprot:GAQ88894.1 UbiA prenyltransferase domain-containing protein [Klebsormidium nitens]
MESGGGSYDLEIDEVVSPSVLRCVPARQRPCRGLWSLPAPFVDSRERAQTSESRKDILRREIGEDERKLKKETKEYRQACKRVKSSLADKAVEYLKVLKAERQNLDKEIEEIQHVAERTQEGIQEEPSASDCQCQMCFRRWGPDRRQAALSCGHAMYCKPCLETYFTTPLARRTRDEERFEDDDEEDSYRCPLGCDIGRNTSLLELFL